MTSDYPDTTAWVSCLGCGNSDIKITFSMKGGGPDWITFRCDDCGVSSDQHGLQN